MVRELIKWILPQPAKAWISGYLQRRHDNRRRLQERALTEQVQRQYEPLSIAETFGRIYASGGWGGPGDALGSSGVGSTGRYVEDYGRLLEQALKKYALHS